MENEKEMRKKEEACLDIAKNECIGAQSRMRDLDNKLNMLLVFISALIVGIGTVVSMPHEENKRCIMIVFIVLIALCIVAAAALIMAGLLPKKYYSINPQTLVDSAVHNLERSQFNNYYLTAYKQCIEKINSVCEKKKNFAIISTGLLDVAFILLVVIILILL